MLRLADLIDALNGLIGRTLAWVAVILVLLQFAIVILRYAFGIGSVWMQEALVYLFATMFMLSSAWALQRGAHVRVDIWYRTASEKAKAAVDILGTVLFLWPVAGLLLWVGWPYAAKSIAILERSQETSGIPAVFVLKTEILLFAALLALQGVSMVIRSAAVLAGAAPPAGDPAHG